MPLLAAVRCASRAVIALLPALLFAGCGRDAAGPTADAAVASVIISGAPTSAVAAGSIVQLTASARDAKGRALDGRTVTWRSDKRAVAGVDLNGRVTTVDSGMAVITATIDAITTSVAFAVTPFPVGAVVVSPRSAKLYVNGTTTLTAEVRNVQGTVVTGKAIAWRSSDATKASVDANGVVAAHALGNVTIYATADGVEGSAVVGVIPDALTDWTAAADWTTFQGNASHSGFVPVTVDPAAFSERWIASFGGAGLQPVAAAEGKIFVTTYSRLFVLDELTGAQKWLYDFGNAGAPGPPAYGDGAVFTATSGTPYLWGFDASTGQIRFRSPYNSQGERYLAPVVAGKRVFFGGGEYGGMYSMSSTTGARQWFDTLAQNSEHTPAVRDGLVYAYVAGWDAAGLTVADTGSGTVAYRIPDTGFTPGFTPVMNTAPALGALDDALVAQGGRLIAFDLVNHSVKWQRAGSFTGAVTIANDTLYVYNGGAIEARQESDGALLWSWTLSDGAPSGTILATSNVLFFGSSSSTWALDRATHTAVWNYPAGGQLALTRGGVLLIAQPTGVLAAIDLR